MQLRKRVIVTSIFITFIGVLLYWSITQYKSYLAENMEKDKRAQEFVQAQQEALETAQQEIEKLKQNINGSRNGISLSKIIEQWKPSVAYVECESYYPDGKLYYSASGSGTLHSLIRINDDNTEDVLYTIYSNKHVLTDPKGYSPQSCRFVFPGYKKIFAATGPKNILISKKFDFAYLIVNEPDSYIKTNIPTRFCEKASIGDGVVIIGYPEIGSPAGITATEGIISGFDGDYYITSAKIDSGNSGGAAVLIKENCYLGIPTFAIVGQIESLGRILNVRSAK